VRTIKRISPKLNKGKFEALQEIASAYAREKQEHLPVYHDDALFAAHKSERTRRDMLVKDKYHPINSELRDAMLFRCYTNG
jgi:DNA-binding cell septation regulator SpoVG